MLCLFLRQGDVLEEMQIEGRSELSDIVEEEEDLYMEDAGEVCSGTHVDVALHFSWCSAVYPPF